MFNNRSTWKQYRKSRSIRVSQWRKPSQWRTSKIIFQWVTERFQDDLDYDYPLIFDWQKYIIIDNTMMQIFILNAWRTTICFKIIFPERIPLVRLKIGLILLILLVEVTNFQIGSNPLFSIWESANYFFGCHCFSFL